MRFDNWRFSEAATYVTKSRKKAVKLHPLRAPSGLSSLAFEAAMLSQRVPEPSEPDTLFPPMPQQPTDAAHAQ